MRLRHWIVFIVLNIIISAAVTLALLRYWEYTHSPRVCEPGAQAGASVTATPTLGPVGSLAPPQPTYTPSPFPHTVYVVQRGDTLSAISRRFDVPVEDLLHANNLTIDTVLSIGQQLKIPTGEQVAPAAPLPSPLPSYTPTPPSSELAPVAEVAVEIRQVIARGDPSREAVVIANLGRPVNLRDWRLSDNNGNVYTFPDLTLWPGGTITLHTGSGPDSVSDLYWGRAASVWTEPSDVATLLDASGNEVARYQLP